MATLNGVNIRAAALASLTGSAPRPVARLSAPQIWRDPLPDRWSAAAQHRHDFPPGRVHDAYFRLNDPNPWLHLVGQGISQRVRHGLPRLPCPRTRKVEE